MQFEIRDSYKHAEGKINYSEHEIIAHSVF